MNDQSFLRLLGYKRTYPSDLRYHGALALGIVKWSPTVCLKLPRADWNPQNRALDGIAELCRQCSALGKDKFTSGERAMAMRLQRPDGAKTRDPRKVPKAYQ